MLIGTPEHQREHRSEHTRRRNFYDDDTCAGQQTKGEGQHSRVGEHTRAQRAHIRHRLCRHAFLYEAVKEAAAAERRRVEEDGPHFLVEVISEDEGGEKDKDQEPHGDRGWGEGGKYCEDPMNGIHSERTLTNQRGAERRVQLAVVASGAIEEHLGREFRNSGRHAGEETRASPGRRREAVAARKMLRGR